MRLLVADDDLITLMALEKCLREWGYEVITARSGSEAWDKLLADQSIQILILDWMMPGLDGITLAQKIKAELSGEEYPPRHIILLSGTDGYEEIIRGLTAGADDYLVKPYSFNELRIRLKRAEKMLILEEEKRQLLSLDPETKLWNRSKTLEFLEEEIARGLRNFYPTGSLLLRVNPLPPFLRSTSSEELEKSVIREMAMQLKKKIRCYDKMGRLGKRELMVILPQTSSSELKIIARRLMENINLEPLFAARGVSPWRLVIAGASTDRLPHPSVQALLAACKRALAIALHLRYPEPVFIYEKKEVIFDERRTSSR